MSGSKGSPTPLVRDKPTAGNALDQLSAGDAEIFASVVGRLIYLAVDRYEVQYAVRGLASEIASPIVWAMMRLKR